MKIKCDFSLKNIPEYIIGSRLTGFSFKKGSIGLVPPIAITGYGEFLLKFHDAKRKCFYRLKLISRGTESIAGDLFGFDIELFHPEKRYSQLGYTFSVLLDDRGSEVVSMSGWGEEQNYLITDKEDLDFWYSRGPTEVPDQITVEKRTMNVIAIQFSSGKWLYITSGGEGDCTLYTDRTEKPADFFDVNGYTEMEVELKLLDEVGK